jgi:hypothetical protein
MEAFYKAYEQGERPTDALRKAQLQTIATLRERTKLAPVRLWALFIVQQTRE